MTSWPYSRSCRTASIRSGRAGGLAGELTHIFFHYKRKAPTKGLSVRFRTRNNVADLERQHRASSPVGLHLWYKPDSEPLDQFTQRKGGINARRGRCPLYLRLSPRAGRRAARGIR
jgi:hypothetical protein